MRPAPVQIMRYPTANSHADAGEEPLVILVYRAIVGATEGNIIAAIITTQTPRNQPRLPSLVQGPASMPRISWIVHTHPMAAMATSAATKPSRARAAT